MRWDWSAPTSWRSARTPPPWDASSRTACSVPAVSCSPSCAEPPPTPAPRPWPCAGPCARTGRTWRCTRSTAARTARCSCWGWSDPVGGDVGSDVAESDVAESDVVTGRTAAPVPLGTGELDVLVARRAGGKVAKALEKAFGIRTVGELLRHYPRRYAEKGELTDLSRVPVDQHVTVVARVQQVQSRKMSSRPGSVVNVQIGDGRGSLDLVFFCARAWQSQKIESELKVGTLGLFSGQVGRYRGRRQLAHPVHEVLPEGEEDSAQERAEKPVVIYPAASGVESWQIAAAVRTVVATLPPLPDPLPEKVRTRRRLMPLDQALRAVHDPATMDQAHEARRRLRYEEAFVLQAALLRRRAAAAALVTTPRHPRPGGLLETFDARLPFPLTAGQREVGEQLAAELAGTSPMHRLLQGEVGSGKTVVALRAMLTVVDSGGQAALLAPTEVLAVQHHRSITAMLGDLAEAGMLGGSDRSEEHTSELQSLTNLV